MALGRLFYESDENGMGNDGNGMNARFFVFPVCFDRIYRVDFIFQLSFVFVSFPFFIVPLFSTCPFLSILPSFLFGGSSHLILFYLFFLISFCMRPCIEMWHAMRMIFIFIAMPSFWVFVSFHVVLSCRIVHHASMYALFVQVQVLVLGI